MEHKIRNLLKTIVYQADDTRTKTIIDANTLQEKECKEITFYISTKAVEEIRDYLKEEENEA